MASATLTTTGQAYGPQIKKPLAIVSNGTNMWIAGSGKVHKYTISGGAYSGVVISLDEEITAMIIYSTHLLIATDKGKVYSYVLSSAAYEGLPLDLVSVGITAMAVSSSVAYITTNDGEVLAYTIG
jgi:hypothetical protein